MAFSVFVRCVLYIYKVLKQDLIAFYLFLPFFLKKDAFIGKMISITTFFILFSQTGD